MVLFSGACWLLPGTARAANCSATVSSLGFGPVDTLSDFPNDSSATISVTCTEVAAGTSTVSVCASLGRGSAPSTGSARQLAQGSDVLLFGLYTDAGRKISWGSVSEPALGDPRLIPLSVNGTNAAGTATVYGRVATGQAGAPRGTYLSTFAGGDAAFVYAEGALDCAAPAGGATTQASFSADASVAANCRITTEDVNFGTHGRITRPVDGQGAVGVTCTPGVDYTIALGTGSGGSSDPTARVMLSGVNRLLYGLYSDVSRTQPWGSTVGAVVTDTGVAGRVSVPVYGRVQPQDVPSGSYADTVTVTITYQ